MHQVKRSIITDKLCKPIRLQASKQSIMLKKILENLWKFLQNP